MTAIEAAGALVFFPLRFGDRGQIAAALFLADVEELKLSALRHRAELCLGCAGKTYVAAGDCECGDDDCNLCSRGYMEACGLCSELGMLDGDGEPWPVHVETTADVRAAVVDWMRANRDKRPL